MDNETESISKKAKTFVSEVASKMGKNVKTDISFDDEKRTLNIVLSGENASEFIGDNGEILDAFQCLTSAAVNKETEEFVHVVIDADNYRKDRDRKLELIAKEASDRVKSEKKPLKLIPMNPYERRIIHLALQNDPDITTESEGKEPHRCLIIGLRNHFQE